MLWIQIASSAGSESGADLVPDPYPFQPNCVQFLEHFQYTVQNIENYDTYDVEVKDYQGRLAMLWISQKNLGFPTSVKSDPDQHQKNVDPQNW